MYLVFLWKEPNSIVNVIVLNCKWLSFIEIQYYFPRSKRFCLKERILKWLWCMLGTDCSSIALGLVYNHNKFIAHIFSRIVYDVYIKAIRVLVICWLVDSQECDLILVSLLETRDQDPLCLQPKGRTSWQACSEVGHTWMTKNQTRRQFKCDSSSTRNTVECNDKLCISAKNKSQTLHQTWITLTLHWWHLFKTD